MPPSPRTRPVRRRALCPALRLVLCLLGIVPTASASAHDRTETVTVAGEPRRFSIHIPDRPAPSGRLPVILAFHGGGMQGAAMRRVTRLDDVADALGFVAVYPDGIDRHWNDGRTTIRNPHDDVGFVAALIDRLEHDAPVDGGRIFATGLSNGALFAERLGCALSSRIAGIAPVAGTLPADIARACRPGHRVAVLQVDGTADPIMPFGGGAVADFGGRGEGGQVLSLAETTAFWAQRNGCGTAGAPLALPPVLPGDRTRVSRTDRAGCPASGPVVAYTVLGGGHAWPGGLQQARPMIIGEISRQIDASQVIAGFFLSLPPR
jgi:polyhydroxybutyrate depolymerase